MKLIYDPEILCVRPLVQHAKIEGTKPLFITISPPARSKVDVVMNGRTRKIPYGSLSQKIQCSHIQNYFKKVYLPICPYSQYVFVFEHNKQGNVHAHGILYDDNIDTQYDLDCLRRTINSHRVTMKYTTFNKAVYFNNIVFCDNVDETTQYLNKDLKQSSKHYPIMINSKLSEPI